ncbi:MAG: hypothetical protein U5J98_03305 [Halobacteriales archaeon]|nr:hypothetical protein [Halobacteriales archaeon]
MADPDDGAFVPFVLDRAGDAVRSVVRYDATDSEVLFLRDDVAETYDALGVETVVASLRREGEQAGRQEHVYAHGELNCIVRAFDGGLEMHFPYGDVEGIAVALEPAAAEHLYGFVDDCLEHLDVEA